MTDQEKIDAMAKALCQINSLIFATAGEPLDADRYFKIRVLCMETLRATDAVPPGWEYP